MSVFRSQALVQTPITANTVNVIDRSMIPVEAPFDFPDIIDGSSISAEKECDESGDGSPNQPGSQTGLDRRSATEGSTLQREKRKSVEYVMA